MFYQGLLWHTSELDERVDTLARVLASPSSAFQRILQNESKYVITSAIILVLAAVFAISPATDVPVEGDPVFERFGFSLNVDVSDVIMGSIFDVLANLVFIVILFFIGKQFGGNPNFKKIFCVMSHAMLPVMVAGMIILVLFSALFYSVQDEIVVADSEASGQDPNQYVGFLAYMGFFGPFAIWSLILSIKAVIIANGFRLAKSIAVFVAASVANYLVFLPVNLLWS